MKSTACIGVCHFGEFDSSLYDRGVFCPEEERPGGHGVKCWEIRALTTWEPTGARACLRNRICPDHRSRSDREYKLEAQASEFFWPIKTECTRLRFELVFIKHALASVTVSGDCGLADWVGDGLKLAGSSGAPMVRLRRES